MEYITPRCPICNRDLKDDPYGFSLNGVCFCSEKCLQTLQEALEILDDYDPEGTCRLELKNNYKTMAYHKKLK